MLYLLAHLELLEGDLESAATAFQRALDLFTLPRFAEERALCLINLGEVEIRRGHLGQASIYGHEALLACERLGDSSRWAVAVGNLGEIALDMGNYQDARRLVERQISLGEKSGDQVWTALGLQNLGILMAVNRDHDSARNCFLQSMVILEGVSNAVAKGSVRYEIANLDWLEGKSHLAEAGFNEILAEVPETSIAGLKSQLGLITLALDRKDLPYVRARLPTCLSGVMQMAQAKEALRAADAATRYLALNGQAGEAAQLMHEVEAVRTNSGFSRLPADEAIHQRLAKELGYIHSAESKKSGDDLNAVANLCKTALSWIG